MNNATDILLEIKNYADNAHGKQLRKYTGERYIVHPARVMEICREFTQELPILASALLHDVLEDTPVNKVQLHDYLLTMMDKKAASKTIQLVEELTDIYTKENFPSMNRRTRKLREAERLAFISAEGQSIKYADIIDNVTDIMHQDEDFAQVYVREAKQMLNFMHKGYAPLKARAHTIIEQCLKNLRFQERMKL